MAVELTPDTWTEPQGVGLVDPFPASQVNEQIFQNLLYLKDRRIDIVEATNLADVNITSTVPAKVASSAFLVQVDTITGNLEIFWNFQVTAVANDDTKFGILINDDYMLGDPVGSGGTSDMVIQSYNSRDLARAHTFSGTIKLSGLATGTWQFEPMFWSPSGTLTVLRVLPNYNQFGVREI